MIDAQYSHQRLVEIYDANNPWGADTEFYLSLAQQPDLNILDLGCGTGILCHGFADRGHTVIGVDPASAMLAHAEQKPSSKQIQWVEATAQCYRSEQRFDLIVMTGHAFQVLLNQADVMSALQTMRQQLKPNGIIAFESRNPVIDWASKWQQAPDSTLHLTSGSVQQSIRIIETQQNCICFEQSVRFCDEVLLSTSTLGFMNLQQIEQCLVLSGFKIRNLYGDWNKSSFNQVSSKEMIFVAELAT